MICGGAAADIRATPAGPVVATSSVLSVAEVNRWLAASQPGERLIYARGPVLLRGDTTKRLRDLADAGEVALFQPRSKDQPGFDYLAVRQLVRRRRKVRSAAVAPDLVMLAVLDLLRSAAKRGARCPTDAEMAVRLGLREPQIHWRVRKLVVIGAIATRIVSTPSTPKYRIVTIVSSGRETKGPGQ